MTIRQRIILNKSPFCKGVCLCKPYFWLDGMTPYDAYNSLPKNMQRNVLFIAGMEQEPTKDTGMNEEFWTEYGKPKNKDND